MHAAVRDRLGEHEATTARTIPIGRRVADLVDPLHAPLEQCRHEEDHRDLGELGRLDAERTENNPSGRAVDPRREEHDNQRHPATPSAVQMTAGCR